MVLTGGVNSLKPWAKVTKYTKTGQAIPLPSLNTGRNRHTCGKITKKDGTTVRSMLWIMFVLLQPTYNLTMLMQFYIVTGGMGPHIHGLSTWHNWLVSTEILKKGGGHSWQTVASLPSTRHSPSGVSLANGHFLLSGEDKNAYYSMFHY